MITSIRSAALGPVLLLLVIALAACNGGGDDSPTPQRSPAATPTPATPVAPTPIAGAIDLSVETPKTTIYGVGGQEYANAFTSLASGDFNDDGEPDVLIGAPFADGVDDAREDSGEAYVVFGRDEWPETLDLAEGGQSMTIYGASDGDNLGSGVLAADINDDGIDDVLVGAPGVTAGADLRTDQGRVYVFFGGSDLGGTFDLADDPMDFVVTGAEGFSRLGQAMASGDVNDDGITDLVLGAPFAGRATGSPPGSPRTEAGEVYAIFGGPDLPDEVATTFQEYDFAVTGDQQFSQFGAAVAVGDVDDDGIDDIVVGSPQRDLDDGARDAAGTAYVFRGGPDLGGRLYLAEGDQDATILGGAAGDSLGAPLGVGDVNGDGVDDIVAGARAAADPESGGAASGATIVMYGGSDLPAATDLSTAAPDAVVYGTHPSDLTPGSLALADLTGDGVTDILLTTVIGPQERRAAGAVYLVAGGAAIGGPLRLQGSVPALALVGASESDELGAALAPVPPVEGRPAALFVLASGADGPEDGRPNSGEILLIELPAP